MLPVLSFQGSDPSETAQIALEPTFSTSSGVGFRFFGPPFHARRRTERNLVTSKRRKIAAAVERDAGPRYRKTFSPVGKYELIAYTRAATHTDLRR
jgi:hypothetical protein